MLITRLNRCLKSALPAAMTKSSWWLKCSMHKNGAFKGPRVWSKGGEAHSSSCLKSSVKFPQSVMIWGAISSAGVCPLCFLQHHCTRLPKILEHFMLPSADQLFKDVDFIFQQDLAPAHTAKSTKSWLKLPCVGVLDWPENSPDLNP